MTLRLLEEPRLRLLDEPSLAKKKPKIDFPKLASLNMPIMALGVGMATLPEPLTTAIGLGLITAGGAIAIWQARDKFPNLIEDVKREIQEFRGREIRKEEGREIFPVAPREPTKERIPPVRLPVREPGIAPLPKRLVEIPRHEIPGERPLPKYLTERRPTGIPLPRILTEPLIMKARRKIAKPPEAPPIPPTKIPITAVAGEPIPEPIRRAPTVERILGIPKAPEVNIQQDLLLRKKLRDEARGARVGARSARLETKKRLLIEMKSTKIETAQVKQDILNYTRENLTANDRGRLLSTVARAKTKKDLARAMQMIDGIEERYQRSILVDDIKETIARSNLKVLRPEYRKEIENLTTDIDLINRRESTIRSITKMRQYIETHPDNNIPDEKLLRLAILDKIKVKDLTTEDLYLLQDSVLHLQKLNDLKNRMIFGRVYRNGMEVVNQANSNLTRTREIKRDPNVISTAEVPTIEVTPIKRLFTTESFNMELITEILDKEPNGVIKQVGYGGIDDGTTDMLRFRQEAEDYFKQNIDFDIINWSETFHTRPQGKVDYQTLKLPSGKIITLTKAERVSLILHARNEKNLRHLLEGGFSFQKNKYVIHKITADDLQTIIQSATPEEIKLADAIHNYFNVNQKARLNERSVQLNGWDIAREPDYFPIRTNALDIKRDALKLKKNFSQRTLEGMGILKERTNAKNAIVLEDAFTAVYKNIKMASSYYGLAVPLRNAKMLLEDKEFQQRLATIYGSHYVSNLKNYLKDIEGGSYDLTNIDRMTLALINKLDVAILSASPWVWSKQVISLAAATTEIDVRYIRRATTPANPQVIRQWSPQLRDRLDGNVTRELGEIGQVGEVRKFFTGRPALGQRLMKGIRTFDYQAIGRIWRAVEFETDALHPELTGSMRMRHIARRTEEIVRKTQPTFMPKDRSAIGRSRSVFIRLLTKYTSQRNKNYMMIRRAVEKYNISPKGPNDKKKLIIALTIVGIVMPAMLKLIDAARSWWYYRKPPKEPRPFRMTILDFLEYNLGNVYFVGNIFRSLRSKIERGTFAGYDISDILTSRVEVGVNAMAEMVRAIDQAMSQERYKAGDRRGELKWIQSAKRAVDHAVSTAAGFTGIGYDAVKRLIMGPFKRISGETEETGEFIRQPFKRQELQRQPYQRQELRLLR